MRRWGSIHRMRPQNNKIGMLPAVSKPPATQTRVVRGARAIPTCSMLWSVNHRKWPRNTLTSKPTTTRRKSPVRHRRTVDGVGSSSSDRSWYTLSVSWRYVLPCFSFTYLHPLLLERKQSFNMYFVRQFMFYNLLTYFIGN